MTAPVRPMTAADLDAVVAIAEASPQAPLWQRAEYALFVADAPQPNSALHRAGLVAAGPAAASGSPILGFACATLLLDGQENRAELDTLAVLPATRRQGIGAALVRAVLAFAAEQGARRLALEVRASNTAALRLYTGLGFAPDGRRPRYYTQPQEDALLLSTTVTPAPSPREFSTENPVEGRSPRC